jgi:hypothetical protein
MRLGCPAVVERSYEGSRISVDLFINGNGRRSLIPDTLSSYCTLRANRHMCLSRCTALLFPSTFFLLSHLPLTLCTCFIQFLLVFFLSTLLSLYTPTFTCLLYYLSKSQLLLAQSIISLYANVYLSNLLSLYTQTFICPIYHLYTRQHLLVQSIISLVQQ